MNNSSGGVGERSLPATQFVVEKESRKILEADGNFQAVTGFKAGTGRNAVYLDSLLTVECLTEASRLIKSKFKKGTVAALDCRAVLKEGGEQSGILIFQPYTITGITSKIVCILALCGPADEGGEVRSGKKADSMADETPEIGPAEKSSGESEAQAAEQGGEGKKAAGDKACGKTEDTKAAARELKTIDDLKNAIENEEFEVYIHPIYSMKTGLAVGGEILTHWIKSGNPAGGFFPQFDEEELCTELDFYILTRSLHALSKSDKADVLRLSFNLSNPIFRAFGFVERLTGLVEAFDVRPDHIMLEIKEELLVSGLYNIIEQVKDLRENGFRVVIDNVGGDGRLLPLLTGRAVDMIKLSHDIIDRALGAESGRDLYRQIVEASLKNNVEIICTRIESEGQYMKAKQSGCVMAQGYLMSRPKSFSDFIKE